MRIVVAVVLMICLLLAPGARADDAVVEIDYLLSSIGNSHCAFIRNGKTYSSQDAEAHLRMKYRHGKRYASSSESFISQLASASSVSKKLYYIECEGEEKVPSGDWLTQRLNEYRAVSDD